MTLAKAKMVSPNKFEQTFHKLKEIYPAKQNEPTSKSQSKFGILDRNLVVVAVYENEKNISVFEISITARATIKSDDHSGRFQLPF